MRKSEFESASPILVGRPLVELDGSPNEVLRYVVRRVITETESGARIFAAFNNQSGSTLTAFDPDQESVDRLGVPDPNGDPGDGR